MENTQLTPEADLTFTLSDFADFRYAENSLYKQWKGDAPLKYLHVRRSDSRGIQRLIYQRNTTAAIPFSCKRRKMEKKEFVVICPVSTRTGLPLTHVPEEVADDDEACHLHYEICEEARIRQIYDETPPTYYVTTHNSSGTKGEISFAEIAKDLL